MMVEGTQAGQKRSLEFRQSMAGTVTFGSSDPFIAAQLGDARGEQMTLRLTVQIHDVDAFLADRQHRTAVSGSLDCEILGGRLPIERGGITFVPGSGTDPGHAIEYWLDFVDQTGRELTLLGTKTVCNNPGLGLWRDASTLDVRLFPRQEHLNGSRPAGPPVLSGQLRLSPLSLLRQLRTFHVTAPTPLRRVQTVLALGGLFFRLAAQGTGSTVSEFDQWPQEEQPKGAQVFVHNERIVPAPPERVWNLLVAAQGWSKFYANAHFVELADPRQHQLRRGSVFRWVTFGFPLTSEVHPCKRPLLIGWRWWGRWWGRGIHGYHIWLLEPHERGTRVVTEETNRGVLPGLARPVWRPMMSLGHNYWLRQLARRASRPAGPRGGPT
jgi:uncharacterized protein YndB with AHSA1/START domain